MTYRLYVVCMMMCATFLAGCTAQVDEADIDRILLSEPTPRLSLAAPIVHDLGDVLAHDQIIDYQFVVTNPTDKQWQLSDAAALMPCCTEIGPVPRSIPPRSDAAVPVRLKPGRKSGLKRFEFQVHTSDEAAPTLEFALVARLVPAWEIEGQASPIVVRAGKAAQVTLGATRRAKTSDALTASATLSCSSPLNATWVGEPMVRDDGDFTAISQRFIVEIPAIWDAGIHSGEIIFSWKSGESERHHISWDVQPIITAQPSGLILKPTSKSTQNSIRVASKGEPFRILSVSSPLLSEKVELSQKAAATHSLILHLNASLAKDERPSQITITTDHPDQAQVLINTLTIREHREDAQ